MPVTRRKSRSKYGNVKTVVDNITFDSKKEAARYQELRILVRTGEISDLELQKRIPITIDGIKVCTYIADFVYKVRSGGETIIEDAKGYKTAIYRLKKKLVKACHGIEITEV